MKKIVLTITSAVALTACGAGDDRAIVLDEQNALNLAYDKSYELCEKITQAANYEEFKRACALLDAYDEAFRTQIGGEPYLIFIEECNALLSDK